MRRDIEDRVGIESIDVLLARRAELVKQVAPLRAMHGPFGKYNDIRKMKLAGYAESIRASKTVEGENGQPVKLTEARVSDLAHRHRDYASWLTDMLFEHAEMINLDNEIRAIDEAIMRDNTLTSYLKAEPK